MTRQEALLCFRALSKLLLDEAKKLTPRERLILFAGLKASHMEEALASGDIPRAEAHFIGILDILDELEKTSRR